MKIEDDGGGADDLEFAPCPLGCIDGDTIVLSGRDMLHGLPGNFIVVRCNSCGLLRTNPRPRAEIMGRYYPDDYGPYLGTRVTPQGKEPVLKRLLRPMIRRTFDSKAHALPTLRPGRMLEVGCASGVFLHQMAQAGWQVQGIEFSATAAEAAARLGYIVYAGALEAAPEPQEPVDLIVGWMVLEHLHDPVAGLKKLKRCAKASAWLVLSVPNAGSLEFGIFKDKWYALQLPTHLYHYTPETIRKLLETSGWTLERIYHQRSLANAIASLGYVLRDRGHAKFGQKLIDFPERGARWAYALFPLAWALGLFGQTGRMTIWARPMLMAESAARPEGQ